MNNQNVDVILLCGGKGTRLAAHTGDETPKSLLKIDDKELIDYTIDSLSPNIVNKLIFAVGHRSDAIRDWVARKQLPYRSAFSESGEGIVPAVRAALDHSESETVVVCNTDEIRYGLRLEEVVEWHRQKQSTATMPVTLADQLHRHRLVEIGDDSTILSSIVKPSYYAEHPDATGMVNVGFITIERAAEQYIDNSSSNGWGALIDPLIANGLCKAMETSVPYFNVGTPQELEEAQIFLQAQRNM